MTDNKAGKPEITAHKKTVKLPPAIGDWTTYKPAKVLVKKVKTGLYGFDRLSKEELNLALKIHYKFIQELLRLCKVDLKMAVELYTLGVEQTTYINFLRTFQNPVVQTRLTLPSMHDPVALVFDLSTANSILNYALGSRDLEPLNRGLTDSENTAFATLFNEYLQSYVAAFANTVPKPELKVVGSPDITIDPAINTSATYVSFSAEIALADNPPAKITMGYLASHLKALLTKYQQQDKHKPLTLSALPQALLNSIVTPVHITLGKTALTTNELHQLEIGDVVLLNTSIDDAISLAIGEKIKLLCQPGSRDERTAVRIASLNQEETINIAPPSIEEVVPPAAPTPPPSPTPAAPQQPPTVKPTLPLPAKPMPKPPVKPPIPPPKAKPPAPAKDKDIFDQDFEDDFLDDDDDDDDFDLEDDFLDDDL
ncbi:MAG: FliM/FliN family flagellar motor switch protein [bacterium]